MRANRAALLSVLSTAAALCGCEPYERRQGEYYAGSVDPVRFPAAYLGSGGRGNRPGQGVFEPVPASVKGMDVFYYLFPLPAAQAGAEDPLSIDELAPPEAFVFDPRTDQPFPSAPRCRKPEGYAFDQARDAFRLDEQGSVFTALPDAMGYVPIVAQVPVTTAGLPCQQVKSEETLRTREDVRVPMADGKLLAWAVINPAADVISPSDMPGMDGSLPPETALGPQRWGWYKHFLLAYLDGGYIPTMTGAMGTRLVPQKLYFPEMVPNERGMLEPGEPGIGFDVLTAARGQPGYSPLCQVFSYKPMDPMRPATDVAQIDQMTVTDQETLIYCLQLQ